MTEKKTMTVDPETSVSTETLAGKSSVFAETILLNKKLFPVLGFSFRWELVLFFAFALAIRLLYNYVLPHVNNFASCDAFEYINNSQALLQLMSRPTDFWIKCANCLAGTANAGEWASIKAALAPLKDFYISGPVFPAFLALSVAIVGGVKSNVHSLWQVLLFGNSMVSALSCVFIALMAKEAFGEKTGRIAALLSALYPGFIVNSGRLYSETFALFLLTALSYLTLRGFRADKENKGNNMVLVFLSGFIAACLQLTRSVMFILTLALLPLTAIQQKGLKKLVFLLPFALGFFIVTSPWLAFQKLAFGGGGLVVDRVGNYNFFIGNNIETHGWLSYPYPDGRNVETRTFAELARQAIEKNPGRWLRLMLDKPLRLFAFPWNDFRTAIGPITFKWQVIFHQFLVLFGCAGLSIALFLSPGRPPEKRELYCRLYIAGLLVFHCIYYLFITVPRYNLTAMPEFIIFAAACLSICAGFMREEQKRLPAIVFFLSAITLLLVLAGKQLPLFVALGANPEVAWILQATLRIGLLSAIAFSAWAISRIMQGQKRLAVLCGSMLAISFIPILALPLRAAGRYQEWHREVSLSTSGLKQTMFLKVAMLEKSLANKSTVYLLLDSKSVKQIADGLSVSINDNRIEGPVLPSMAFAENFDRYLKLEEKRVQREGEGMWDALTNSADCGNLDLRQWSMLPLPSGLLQEICRKARAENKTDARLDVLVQNRSLAPLRIFGSYDLGKPERIIPSLNLYSWEKVFYGVENRDGLTDTRYDIKVPASTLLVQSRDLSERPGLQNGVYNMAILISPAPNSPRNKMGLCGLENIAHFQFVETASLKHPGAQEIKVRLSSLPKDTNEIWVYRLRGRSRVLSGDVSPQAELETAYLEPNGPGYVYKSAWTPRRLSASKEWRDFEFVVPLKPIVEKASVDSAILSLKVCASESPYLNTFSPLSGNVEFAGLVLDVYRLPANPIGLGHQVF